MGVCRDSAESATKVYRERHPETTLFYAVLFHHFEVFMRVYDDRFQKEYGRWRSVIQRVVERYLGCGILTGGFSRLKCDSCGEEKLLAFSCKGRGFCPSCSAKRAVLWSQFIRDEVLQPVPHFHVVFSIPKMLRIFFKFHRELLPRLSLCAWEALKAYFGASLSADSMPAAILSIQTSGQFLNFHPHIHGLVVAGGFRADGSFEPCPVIDRDTVEKIFQAKVFALLLEKGLIGPELVTKMRSWRHSGFNIYVGPAILKIEDIVRVGLYIVRAPAASGRLTLGDGPTLKYLAKSFVGGEDEGRLFESPGEVYDVLEWIARVTSHIPDRGAQLIHYYAAYSNAHRGKLRQQAATRGSGTKEVTTTGSPVEDESDWVKQRRRSWAALVQLVYEVNPLLCRCGGTMRMIAVISASEQPEVVDRILKCVDYRFEVLQLPARPPPTPEPEPSESSSDGYFM